MTSPSLSTSICSTQKESVSPAPLEVLLPSSLYRCSSSGWRWRVTLVVCFGNQRRRHFDIHEARSTLGAICLKGWRIRSESKAREGEGDRGHGRFSSIGFVVAKARVEGAWLGPSPYGDVAAAVNGNQRSSRSSAGCRPYRLPRTRFRGSF